MRDVLKEPLSQPVGHMLGKISSTPFMPLLSGVRVLKVERVVSGSFTAAAMIVDMRVLAGVMGTPISVILIRRVFDRR